jgi:hypothetical protein
VTESEVDIQRQASDATIAWCLRRATHCEQRGELDRAALWAYLAAGTATEFGHSWLASPPLETLLARLAARVPERPRPHAAAVGPAGRPSLRWLHVFSMTFGIGGHTALARRWIARNPFGERHSVALTMQPEADAESRLAGVARATGGSVHSLASSGTLLQRAAALRQIAYEQADVVALHTHGWDVVPPLAFGIPGGPPVLLINHADHAFWTGCATADCVVDIRDSGAALSKSLRGVRASHVLPLPLEDAGPAPRTRALAAARLPDPRVLDRSLVLLTIGSAHKYVPHPALDFPATCARIVASLEDCVLIMVGVGPGEPAARELRERTNGRVVVVGPDPELAAWHAAADVYLEGFPIGSYTALLEVVLAGRAVVRKPYLVSPSILPIDRGALADIEPPPDMDAYVAQALALAGDAGTREAKAAAGRLAVQAMHCGEGWDAQLDALRRALPAEHRVGLGFEPPPIPDELARYRTRIGSAGKALGPLAFAQKSANENGLNPRTDIELIDAMRRAQA